MEVWKTLEIQMMRFLTVQWFSGGPSAIETVDLDSIPGRVKPKTLKIVFTVSLLDD